MQKKFMDAENVKYLWNKFNTRVSEGIDIGKLQDDISSFTCTTLKITSWGISFPNQMEVETSKDGSAYTKAGTAKLSEADKAKDIATFVLNLEKPVSARYVRFIISGNGWTFLSELEVIRKEKAEDPGQDPGEDPGEDPKPEFKTGDINGDGNIGPLDYMFIRAYYLKTNTNVPAEYVERMNLDGKAGVTPMDVMLLRGIILGTYKPEAK